MRSEYLLIRAALFILIVGVGYGARAADSSPCCDCPIPSVGIFDFTHFDSNDRSDGANWPDALRGFLEGYAPVVRQDAVCSLHFTSLALGAKYKDLVKDGRNPGNQAARGDFDYLLQGKILGTEGHYDLKVILADGTTAEHIWEVNEIFTSAADAKTAGINNGHNFADMFDKICDYWRKKREENTENAVEPRITIKPQKEKTNVGEPVSVEVTALDCDHSVLKGRKITLSSEHGTFAPQTVTTDADGKATATFKPSKAGIGTIQAEINYTSIVKHKPKRAHGWKQIQIGDPPSGVWRITINVTEEVTSRQDFHKSEDGTTQDKTGTKSVRSTASLTLLEGSDFDPTFKKFNSGELMSFGGGGEFSHLVRQRNETSGEDTYRLFVLREDGGGTLNRTDMNAFSFEVGPDKAWINGTVPLTGSYDDFTYSVESGSDPCCVRQEQTVDETQAIEFGYGSDKVEIAVTPQDAKAGTYVFHLDKTETLETKETGETEKRTRTGTIILQRLTRSQAPSQR